jgi:hypothetical protein
MKPGFENFSPQSVPESDCPGRHTGPILRMVIRPLGQETTRQVRFGSFAGGFRAKKVFRSGHTEDGR